MARFTARQRGVIRRRLLKDEQKRKRITSVLSLAPMILVLGYMGFIFLETFWVAVGAVGVWIIVFIVVNVKVFSDRSLGVSLLFGEIEEHWNAFNERIKQNPAGPRFKSISSGYETIVKRYGEIDEKPVDLKPLVEEVYSGAVALAAEWMRQDKVYQFYERARDIDSSPWWKRPGAW